MSSPPQVAPTSPWHYETADYQGLKVKVDIAFNTSTMAIVNPGLSGTRDVGCLYDRVVIGRPDGVQKVFLIPEGAFNVGRAILSNQGYSTIDQVTAGGFTVGTSETPT